MNRNAPQRFTRVADFHCFDLPEQRPCWPPASSRRLRRQSCPSALVYPCAACCTSSRIRFRASRRSIPSSRLLRVTSCRDCCSTRPPVVAPMSGRCFVPFHDKCVAVICSTGACPLCLERHGQRGLNSHAGFVPGLPGAGDKPPRYRGGSLSVAAALLSLVIAGDAFAYRRSA